jgi:hypothetical protein
MADTVTPPPPKGIGTIQLRDFVKGLYYAGIGQVLLIIGFIVSSLLQKKPVLPTWEQYLPYLQSLATTLGGYILGKFGVNNVGQILTKNKEVVNIATDTLDDLKDKADKADEIDKNVTNL